MTLTEKLTLIHDGSEDAESYQVQARYSAGISRLGFQGCASWTDCRDADAASFAGRDGDHGRGSIFDIRLADANGVVIGREACALGKDVAVRPSAILNAIFPSSAPATPLGMTPR
jgi:beta-glucosidase